MPCIVDRALFRYPFVYGGEFLLDRFRCFLKIKVENLRPFQKSIAMTSDSFYPFMWIARRM